VRREPGAVFGRSRRRLPSPALIISLIALLFSTTGLADAARHTVLSSIAGHTVSNRPHANGLLVLGRNGKFPAAAIPTVRNASHVGGKTAEQLAGSCPPPTVDLGTWCLDTAPYPLTNAQAGKNNYVFAAKACEALKKQGFDISSQDNLGRARGQAGVKSAKAGYAGGWVWSFSSSVNRSEPSVPSEPWQTNPSKTPKSPKTPTKTPKTPISSSKEEPVSSTPEPSLEEGAATFWEDNSLLQGTVSASPMRTFEGRSR